MKKTLLMLSVLVAAALFSSCASVEIVKGDDLHGQDVSLEGETIGHANAQNWGLYLFTIPLLTGSTENVGKISIFKDTVNPECMLYALTAECQKEGATHVYNVTSQAGTWGLLIYSRTINMSGNAFKVVPPAPAAK